MFGFGKKEKTLEDHLYSTKKIIVQEVIFHIRKVDVLHYMEGAKVMVNLFQTYSVKGKTEHTEQEQIRDMKKAKDYMRDIIMAGVVKPKLKRKEEDEGILVDEVLSDWFLAKELSEEIMAYTLSKKK